MKAAELTNPVIGPGFPDEWYGWPLDVELAFKLWAGTCVYGGLYAEYRVDTIEAGARTLYNPDTRDLWPIYRLHTEDPVTPVYRYNLTRPLWRRTDEEDLEDRERVGGPSGAPWDEIADDTLLQIWFEGRPTAWSEEYCADWPPQRRCAMLTVGARTYEEADRTWRQCAKVMQRIYREVTGWGVKT